MNIDPHLGNQRVGKGKLGQRISSDRELTDADNTNPELRQGENATGKLTDGEDACSRNRIGRYLKEMWSQGRPRKAASVLYSKPHPPHFSFAGNGAPQCGQAVACSEIPYLHSRHGFMYTYSNLIPTAPTT